MDIDKIALTFPEKHILKKSIKHEIEKDKCERLLRFGLVTEEMRISPGNKPCGTGKCKISPLGIDYLRFRKDFNRTRFSIPIVVSLLTNLALYLMQSEILPLLKQLLSQI